jgi:4'-phosphopantetheinyl transferase
MAKGTDALPAHLSWLAPTEAQRLDVLRFPKRRTEFLLRRLVAKHAVATTRGLPTDPGALARIEVGNAAGGAPYVLVDGAPPGLEISLSDRAGWAVCVVGASPVGCDLELVEPRSPGFVRDFLTGAEQAYVISSADRDLAANLVWSAKESALKLVGTGLRRDTRDVIVTVHDGPRPDWSWLSVHVSGGLDRRGWWLRAGRFVLTVVPDVASPPPVALMDPAVLASAVPVELTPAAAADRMP